jgi:hypothetical protein
MSHIWHALLDEPKASVTANFDGGWLRLAGGLLLPLLACCCLLPARAGVLGVEGLELLTSPCDCHKR